jgi:hypothetical protein
VQFAGKRRYGVAVGDVNGERVRRLGPHGRCARRRVRVEVCHRDREAG